ncbi:MAG: UbiA family prenyltransferase [Schleiferiaceae bacterium]
MPTRNPKPFLRRLWQYQAERFPLAALVPTTAAVLYSTWAVLRANGADEPLWKYLALGVAGLSFLLHTRLIDELRDRDVDDVHHPDRPLQRGLVTADELTRLGYANGGIFVALHALLDPLSGMLSAGLLAYSLAARYEIGPLRWLKPRFYLYNVVMLAQMLLLQWIAYAALTQSLDWAPALWWHGWSIWALSAQIEIARKCLAPEDETAYRDSYSARLGTWGSAALTLAVTAVATACMLRAATDPSLLAAGLALAAVAGGGIAYALKPNRGRSKVLQGMTVLAYLLINLIP